MAERYDAVVGVNCASHHYQTDWIVALDPTIWRFGNVFLPKYGLVSYATQPPDVLAKLKENDLELQPFGDRIVHRSEGICSYTFPYALRFCLENWPSSDVRIYGLDMTAGFYPQFRWDKEKLFIRDLVHSHGDRIQLVGCAIDPSTIGLP
jgi:hypothetical protein